MKKVKVAELELKILNVLWNQGKPATVQDVLNHWCEDQIPGYTTVLKKLQVMQQKGFVDHQSKGKAYEYYPLIARESLAEERFQELDHYIFSGDKMALTAAFLGNTRFSRDELEKVKAMIEQLEKEAEQ